MRCEHCGCVGVEVMGKLDKREKAKALLLSTLLFKPAVKFAAAMKSQPYCVRCRKRVKGDGIARRDLMCDFNPEHGVDHDFRPAATAF